MHIHPGERAVQQRAGVGRDDWGSAGVGAQIPAVAGEFLRQQPMLIVGAADDRGAVWASLLTGPVGLVRAADERTIVVDAVPPPEDPLANELDAGQDIGALAIEPETRRRMRANGQVRRDGDRLVIQTDQVFANCPKYITSRRPRPVTGTGGPGAATRGVELTGHQQRWIAAADSFFVATSSPGHGADVSHRGGNPGFVGVAGPWQLWWPDYVGNSMYMTLGNLELSAACGLLFVDWEHGHCLQLSGRATVDWDADRAASVPGAQRIVDFAVDRVVETRRASVLRWASGDLFRHNPPVDGGRRSA